MLHKYILKTQRPLKSIYGIYLTPNYNDTTFKYYFKGTYGQFLLNLLKQQKEKAIFIDIGANQGLFSILASKNKAIEKVIAFEPSHTTVALLTKNLEVNGITNCQIEAAAISNTKGEMQLNAVEGHSGKSSLREISSEDSNYEMVSVVTHTELNNVIPQHTEYIVKIDVEGHESEVIDELVQCDFIKNTRWIFCEINENWVDFTALKNKLAQHHFTKFKKIGAHPTEYDVLFQKAD